VAEASAGAVEVRPAPAPEVPALDVRDLTVRYPGVSRPAVEDVSFSVAPGEVVALIGPNGSGKSTLIKAVLDAVPHEGEVRIFGEPFARAWPLVGYVPQHFAFDRAWPITVLEVVRLPLAVRRRPAGRAVVLRALARVNAAELADRSLATLSGGERQRVLLARALVTDPRLLILDEPEAGIDVGGEQTLYELLADLAHRERLSVLVASHELDVVYQYTAKVVCINRRLICQGRPAEVLTAETLEAMYGRFITVYPHAHGPEHGG